MTTKGRGMRRLLTALLLSTSLAAGTVTTAVPASADTPGCVTHKEYKQVHKGMKKWRVHRIFDTRGEGAGGGAGGYTRFYGSCEAIRIGGGDGGAYVTYNGDTNRVLEKRWIGYA